MTHYYFDSTYFGLKTANYFGKIFMYQFQKLEFELREIQDHNGELILIKIPRKDICIIQKNIINSKAFQHIYRDEWNYNRVSDFINKGLIDGSIVKKDSMSRTLFLIQVVHWFMQKENIKNVKLFINGRPWWSLYKDYASNMGISLLKLKYSRELLINQKIFIKNLRKFPYLYGLLKNIKSGILRSRSANYNIIDPQLYLYGRGDINLKNNGYHSDFFWYLNSSYSKNNIIYESSSNKNNLAKLNGIKIVCWKVNLSHSIQKRIPFGKYSRKYYREYKHINSFISSYNSIKTYWNKFFETYNVRVYLTWFKFDNSHMAIADAVKDVGGIFAVWQMAFIGHKAIGTRTNADIIFTYSKLIDNIEKKVGSKYHYNIITGYLKDYTPQLLVKEATNLRKNLEKNGAKKIVAIFDENSDNDPRWHTGHALQRENYSYILEKILEIPWLGVVFKPKNVKTLRQRLGFDIAKLLSAAKNTGRCYIYETSGSFTTLAPPILAGLSADICIHSHLASGTAAIECALEGLPTLLIDREGCPYSKFYELEKGKVIFQDWPQTIETLMEHFQTNDGIAGFGDWSSIINEFDPFRDGKAANRMGTYLNWLIHGYKNGLPRETIMENAAERYAEKWGFDKVIINA